MFRPVSEAILRLRQCFGGVVRTTCEHAVVDPHHRAPRSTHPLLEAHVRKTCVEM